MILNYRKTKRHVSDGCIVSILNIILRYSFDYLLIVFLYILTLIDLYYIFVFLRFYITSFYYFVKIANEGKKHEKLNSIDSVIISFQIKQDCNVNDKKTL